MKSLDRWMHNRAELGQDGGEQYKLSDCYVWSEIYYLDSPTNFRECIVPDPKMQGQGPQSPLVVLENGSLWGDWEGIAVILSILVFVILAIVMWCY